MNKKYAEENFRKVATGTANEIKVYVTKYGDTDSWMFLNTDPDGTPGAEIPQYGTGGTLRANMPATPLDNSVVNKKYAEDHYVQVVETEVGQWKIYASRNGDPNAWLWGGPEALADLAVVIRANNGCIYTNIPDAANMKDTTVLNKKYTDEHYVKSDSTKITDPSSDAIELLSNGYYTLTEKATTGFTNNLTSSYYAIAMFKFSASEGYAIAQDVTNNKMYVASFSSATGTKGWNEIPNIKYIEDNFLKVYDLGAIGSGEVKIPGMNSPDGTTNEQKWFPTCVGEYVANSAIALTDAQGHLGTNTPTANKHCANKEYVDDAIANIPLKTLFGNQDIHGTGNIDLYRHNIRITVSASGFGAEIYFTYYSSNNLQVDSLTDLKTLMGDTFIESVSGNTSTRLPVQYITESAFNVQGQNYTWASMTSITITDGVKTI